MVSIVLPAARAVSKRPPLGAMSIAAMLEKYGISVNIIDLKTSEDEKELHQQIIAEVRSNIPKYLGISCMSTELNEVKEIAREIKLSHPQVVVVVGGIHATFAPEDFFQKDSSIDYVCIGDGEITFLELIQTLEAGKDPCGVNGLLIKRGDEVVKTNPRDYGSDLDYILPPAYHLVPMDYYLQPNEWLIRGVPLSGFYQFTSRGCPFSCTFCGARKTKVRYKSPKLVVDEIEYLKKTYGIDALYFYDDTFSIKKKHVLEICREIRKRRINILWGCETRANLLSDDLLKEMKKSGCIQIDFGIETGSDRLGGLIEKGVTAQEGIEAFRLCKKHGIRTAANYLFNLPGETEEDVKQTINLATQLDANLNIFNIMTLYPGHPIFEQYKHLVDPDDYKKFQNYVEYDQYLDLIERKYRLAEHKIPFKKLTSDLSKKFLSRQFKLSKISFHLIEQAFHAFNYFFWLRYWKVLFNSSRKPQYVGWAVEKLRKGTLKYSV